MDSKDIQSIDGLNKDMSWTPEELEEDQEPVPPPQAVDPIRSAKNRMLTSTLVLALLVIGAVTTFYISRRTGDIRQRASSTPCTTQNESLLCAPTEFCLITNTDLGIGTCTAKSSDEQSEARPTLMPMLNQSTSTSEATTRLSNAPNTTTCQLSVNGNTVNSMDQITQVKKGSVVRISASASAGNTGLALSPIEKESWIRPISSFMTQNTITWNWTAMIPEGAVGNRVYVVCNNTVEVTRCTGNPWCENEMCSPILDCGSSDKLILEII